MRWSRRVCRKPKNSSIAILMLLALAAVVYLKSSSSNSHEQPAKQDSLKDNRLHGNAVKPIDSVGRRALNGHLSAKDIRSLNDAADSVHLAKSEHDDFSKEYFKKREQLRKNIIDSGLARKKAAIESQKALGNKNIKHALPSDENDPLIQLKLKEAAVSLLKSRADNERKRANKDKLLSERSQRKLLVEEHLKQRKKLSDKKQDRKALFDSDTDLMQEKMQDMMQDKMKGLSRISKLGSFDMEAYLGEQRMTADTGGDPMKRFQFNQIASDAIPPDRYLKDYRHPTCQHSHDLYQSDLPPVSIVICFHNEARSALLRTIVSVLNRSPPNLLEEIILVDDFSENTEDGELLKSIPKVKLIRLDSRHGLIKARIIGTKEAVGPVLLFLDSHCEVTPGWLEPLLSRIKMNSSHLVSPVIDILNKDNMQYTTASSSVRGGFGPNLHFKWDTIPREEIQSRQSVIAPIRTPAIAGGLFAVDKKWFEHIGLYDEQMEIWGGENVELSLRVWMCGGTMEIIPCSHVGHIFRSAMPYSFGEGGTYHSTVTRNIRRTVEVWLDGYKPYYYEKNPFSLKIDYGDISERQELRKKLHCKSFKWYLNNIYPQFDAPPIQDFTYGQLRSSGLCLDIGKGFAGQPVSMEACKHDTDIQGQDWAMYSKGGVKHHTLCLALTDNRFILHQCNSEDRSQMFNLLPNGLLVHTATMQCVTNNEQHLTLVQCDVEHNTDSSIEWDFIPFI